MRFSSGVMFSRRPQTLVLFVIFVSVVAALSVVVLGGSAVARGTMQLCVLPLSLVLFSKIAFGGVRLPRALLGVSVICALSGAVVRYSDIGLVPGAFLVARLDNDSMLSKTHILRDKVRSFAGKGALSLVGAVNQSVPDHKEAVAFLEQRPQLGGLVWGDEHSLVVTMRPTPPIRLSSFPPSSVARILLHRADPHELFLVTSVPRFSIAKALDSGTMEFVGRMLPLVSEFSSVLEARQEQLDYESKLRGVTGIKSTWRALPHRAMPMFMTGTYHLVLAISGPKISWGDLLCAELSLVAAERQLGYYDNPALQTAIVNNLAIARLARSYYVADPKPARKMVHDLFAQARRLTKHPFAPAISESFWAPIRANISSMGFSGNLKDKKRSEHAQ